MAVKTTPDLSASSAEHIAAIKSGNDHFTSWQRNVIDEFKSLSEDEIKVILKEKSFPFAVLFENWLNDFNLSSGIRNANAFNAREVFYLGNKRFDRRGMCGVHNYTDIKFLTSIDEFLLLKDKYTFVGIDNIPGAISIDEYKWNKDTLMIFGSEGVGLTPEMRNMCKDIVYIKQFGSVRSINCATASGIVMHDFVSGMEKQ